MAKEFKTPRTLQAIQQEYGVLCARAGQVQYQQYALAKDLEALNDALRDLNFEAAAAQQEAAQKAAEEKAAAEKTVQQEAEIKSIKSANEGEKTNEAQS